MPLESVQVIETTVNFLVHQNYKLITTIESERECRNRCWTSRETGGGFLSSQPRSVSPLSPFSSLVSSYLLEKSGKSDNNHGASTATQIYRPCKKCKSSAHRLSYGRPYLRHLQLHQSLGSRTGSLRLGVSVYLGSVEVVRRGQILRSGSEPAPGSQGTHLTGSRPNAESESTTNTNRYNERVPRSSSLLSENRNTLSSSQYQLILYYLYDMLAKTVS